MNRFAGVLFPLLLHLCTTELVAAISGGMLDAAACTLLSALLTLPWAVWMFRKDRAEEKRSWVSGSARALSGRPAGFSKGAFWNGVVCFFAGGLLNIVWSGLMSYLQLTRWFSNQTQEALLAGSVTVQLLSVGLFVPLAEELVFRGLIYRRMRGLLPCGAAILLSSGLFAVCHGNVIQMLFAFPMAVVLCVLYEKQKALRCPVLFHMGCNVTAILVNWLSR